MCCCTEAGTTSCALCYKQITNVCVYPPTTSNSTPQVSRIFSHLMILSAGPVNTLSGLESSSQRLRQTEKNRCELLQSLLSQNSSHYNEHHKMRTLVALLTAQLGGLASCFVGRQNRTCRPDFWDSDVLGAAVSCSLPWRPSKKSSLSDSSSSTL